MIILSKEQILLLHAQLIEETGGSKGLKDEGMLDSALAAPFQSFDGKDLFPSVYQKAARLGYGLASNHAFVDGNKRIGAHTMLVFLSRQSGEEALIAGWLVLDAAHRDKSRHFSDREESPAFLTKDC